MPEEVKKVPPVTRLLAEWAAALRYEDIPEEVIHRVRTDAMDAVAVGLFGSTLPWVRLAVDYWEELGGKPQARLWGRHSKLPVPKAVLSNCHAMNSFEYDDTYVWSGLGTHQGNNVNPATIAVAELVGGVSGKEYVTALVAGHEIGVRIILGFTKKRAGYNHTAIVSTFGAAAAAGRLLHLNAEQMKWALGSAGSYVGGLLTLPPSSMVKRMVNGRAAEGGTIGALLAKRGFTGIENVLEAERGGYYNLYSDAHDLNNVLGDLGRTWHCVNLHTKRFPMCTSIHAPIEAACEVVRNNRFSVDDVTEIMVHTTTGAQGNTVGFWPDTISSAQLSLAFGVAIAILTGNVRPVEVTEKALTDPKIKHVMELIKPYKDPALDAIWKGVGGPAEVEVKLRNGKVLKSSRIPDASRMTDAEIEDKARDAAGPVVGKQQIEEIIRFFRGVDKLDRIDSLFELLQPKGK